MTKEYTQEDGRALMIVPGLAFSDTGYRIGYGKGFYDRYLSSFTKRDTVMAVGVGYDFQLLSSMIGATTENPYFEVNGALISRSIIFELKPLEKEDIEKLLERAVTDPVKGLGTYNVVLDADAKEFLADIAGGDARAALNAIELGVLSTERQADGKIHIDLETASECIQKRVVRMFRLFQTK